MGSLAAWGAVAGVGKGIQANAEQQQKVDFAKLEEEREMRLRQYEAERDDQRQQVGFQHDDSAATARMAHEDASQKIGFEHDESILGKRQSFEGKESATERSFKAGEGAKDRTSAEKIANTRASATSRGAGKSRWQSINITQTTQSEFGPVSTTTPALFDKVAGATYRQNGDKYFLTNEDGTTNPLKGAAPSAQDVNYLLAHPDKSHNFARRFGYLPARFISSLSVGSSNDSTDEE